NRRVTLPQNVPQSKETLSPALESVRARPSTLIIFFVREAIDVLEGVRQAFPQVLLFGQSTSAVHCNLAGFGFLPLPRFGFVQQRIHDGARVGGRERRGVGHGASFLVRRPRRRPRFSRRSRRQRPR